MRRSPGYGPDNNTACYNKTFFVRDSDPMVCSVVSSKTLFPNLVINENWFITFMYLCRYVWFITFMYLCMYVCMYGL